MGHYVILVDRYEALRRYNTLRKVIGRPTEDHFLTYYFEEAILDGCVLEAKET